MTNHSNPEYVLGAVLAQLEDLTPLARLAVLYEAQQAVIDSAPLLDQHHSTDTDEHRGVLTVGYLRTILQGVDADLHVVTDDKNGWYDNVGEVVVPCPDRDHEYQCVTFIPGVTFDTRQI